jgi:hypothetical protein
LILGRRWRAAYTRIPTSGPLYRISSTWSLSPAFLIETTMMMMTMTMMKVKETKRFIELLHKDDYDDKVDDDVAIY